MDKSFENILATQANKFAIEKKVAGEINDRLGIDYAMADDVWINTVTGHVVFFDTKTKQEKVFNIDTFDSLK